MSDMISMLQCEDNDITHLYQEYRIISYSPTDTFYWNLIEYKNKSKVCQNCITRIAFFTYIMLASRKKYV